MFSFFRRRGTERHWSSRLVLFLIGLAVIIVVAIAILDLDRPAASRHDPRTTDAYVGGDVTPIAARVQGYLIRLPVADNQRVLAGDVIGVIEPVDYQARVDNAAAQVAAASARLQVLDQQQKQLVQQTSQTRSTKVAAEADVTEADPELRRQQALIKTELGEARSLEKAEADQKRARASVEAAAAMVGVREHQAQVLDAERDTAAATLAARQADLDLANINLGWTKVLAPVDGTLGARLVRAGDLITVGRPIVGLTPLDAVWVDANFTERQITYIHSGERARLVLDAYPQAPLDGHVVGLSPTTGGALSAIPPDNTTGNFTKVVQRVPVRIAIDWQGSDLRGLVRPGMSVTATVYTDGDQIVAPR